MVALMIPNAEIKDFETTVVKWFDDRTKVNQNALFDAVWNGDSEGITREMNALLRRTLSTIMTIGKTSTTLSLCGHFYRCRIW